MILFSFPILVVHKIISPPILKELKLVSKITPPLPDMTPLVDPLRLRNMESKDTINIKCYKEDVE